MIYMNQDLVEPDRQGRVLLPAHHVKDLGLAGKVTIIGSRTHLEIWDPTTLAAREAADGGRRMPSAAASFVTEMAMAHVPVLTQELLRLLDVQEDSRVVDCTFGAGGHAEAVVAGLGPDGLLVACDRDPVAEDYYMALSERLRCPSRFYRGNFADSLEALLDEGESVTHVYMDLGLSSMQIDTPERGFSYSYDAPLDMRMDPSLQVTAADLLNTWPEAALAELFGRYGEERYSRRIARAIVARRASGPYRRTSELVETIKDAIPTPARFAAGNPARRVFQALRIEVNDELQQPASGIADRLRPTRQPGGSWRSSVSTRWRTGWSRSSLSARRSRASVRPISPSARAAPKRRVWS